MDTQILRFFKSNNKNLFDVWYHNTKNIQDIAFWGKMKAFDTAIISYV